MKKYHVATGDGKGYYGVNYDSYYFASELLKIAQRHDPQAHIVEEEYYFTNADRIRAMSDDELARKLVNAAYRYDWKQDEDYWYFPNGTTKTNYKPKAIEAWLEWLKQPEE